VRWSNHPSMGSDGAALPNLRGVLTTEDGAKVLFDLTGRTVWVIHDGKRFGEQRFIMLLESDADRYSWLNESVCMCEGYSIPMLGLHGSMSTHARSMGRDKR
jgi:hypothetical protein